MRLALEGELFDQGQEPFCALARVLLGRPVRDANRARAGVLLEHQARDRIVPGLAQDRAVRAQHGGLDHAVQAAQRGPLAAVAQGGRGPDGHGHPRGQLRAGVRVRASLPEEDRGAQVLAQGRRRDDPDGDARPWALDPGRGHGRAQHAHQDRTARVEVQAGPLTRVRARARVPLGHRREGLAHAPLFVLGDLDAGQVRGVAVAHRELLLARRALGPVPHGVGPVAHADQRAEALAQLAVLARCLTTQGDRVVEGLRGEGEARLCAYSRERCGERQARGRHRVRPGPGALAQRGERFEGLGALARVDDRSGLDRVVDPLGRVLDAHAAGLARPPALALGDGPEGDREGDTARARTRTRAQGDQGPREAPQASGHLGVRPGVRVEGEHHAEREGPFGLGHLGQDLPHRLDRAGPALDAGHREGEHPLARGEVVGLELPLGDPELVLLEVEALPGAPVRAQGVVHRAHDASAEDLPPEGLLRRQGRGRQVQVDLATGLGLRSHARGDHPTAPVAHRDPEAPGARKHQVRAPVYVPQARDTGALVQREPEGLAQLQGDARPRVRVPRVTPVATLAGLFELEPSREQGLHVVDRERGLHAQGRVDPVEQVGRADRDGELGLGLVLNLVRTLLPISLSQEDQGVLFARARDPHGVGVEPRVRGAADPDGGAVRIGRMRRDAAPVGLAAAGAGPRLGPGAAARVNGSRGGSRGRRVHLKCLPP